MPIAENAAERTTAVVLAGGKGSRLDPLTRRICKPALPFGGRFRCIDFSLSNCVNSGVRKIGVATQYETDALLSHLWSHWNSSAVGDAAVVHAWRAEERAARFGYCGTADAVYRNLPSIPRSEDALVLVLAGDHVYKMDYRPMLEAHCARNAALTIGCVHAPACGRAAFRRRGRWVTTAASSDSSRSHGRPRNVPRASNEEVLASMGIYVFDAAFLARILHIDAAQSESGHDFGSDILPRLIESGCAYSYAYGDANGAAPAYWRDIGTLGAYWRAHMELLGPTPLMTLTDPSWPIGRVTATPQVILAPTATSAGGTVEDSIVPAKAVSPGECSGPSYRTTSRSDAERGWLRLSYSPAA